MDFSVVLSTKGCLPISQQLALELRQAILTGQLDHGQRLPSAQDLARSLAVSRTTILKVYQRLVREGFLQTQPGYGTSVRCDPLFALPDNLSSSLTINCAPPSPSNLNQIILDAHIDTEPATTSTLNVGYPPADLLPIRPWRTSLMRNCQILDSRTTKNQEVFGYRPLREVLVTHLRNSKAVRCSADQMIVFSSPESAMHCIATLLVNEGDTVIVENPGSAQVRHCCAMRQANIKSIEVDQCGLNVDGLEKVSPPCKLVCVSLSHQIPTGAILSMERRQRLIDWAERNDAYILEESSDSDYHYGTAALPALQGLCRTDRVLYSYNFCSVLFPLVSMGVLVVPEHLVNLFVRAKRLTEPRFALIEQYALTDLIETGSLQHHISKNKIVYQTRRQALIFNLKQRLRDIVAIPPFSAGLHQMISLRSEVDEELILNCARLADLPMVSTSGYYATNPRKREFLIPFARIADASTVKMVADFANYLEQAEARSVAPMATANLSQAQPWER